MDMDKLKLWGILIVNAIVSIVIIRMFGVHDFDTNLFCGVVLFFVIGILEIFAYMKKEKNAEKMVAKKGIIYLSPEEKVKMRSKQSEKYTEMLKESQKNAEQRYTIDFDTINKVMNLTEGLVRGNIAYGSHLQNTDAPQKDWAIAGGLASGIGGAGAGIAAAVNTMAENQRANEARHESGRKMVEDGYKSLEQLEKTREQLSSKNFHGLTATEPDSSLIYYIQHKCTDTLNYDTGYVTLKMNFFAKRDFDYPSGGKGAIDGTVRVDLYDKSGNTLLASGYYAPPGRYGNDTTGTGFGAEGGNEVEVVVKLNSSMSFNKYNGYIVKLSNPNLWLLKQSKY